MILADIGAEANANAKSVVHHDGNGFACAVDRLAGEGLAGEKFDPEADWSSHVAAGNGRLG